MLLLFYLFSIDLSHLLDYIYCPLLITSFRGLVLLIVTPRMTMFQLLGLHILWNDLLAKVQKVSLLEVDKIELVSFYWVLYNPDVFGPTLEVLILEVKIMPIGGKIIRKDKKGLTSVSVSVSTSNFNIFEGFLSFEYRLMVVEEERGWGWRIKLDWDRMLEVLLVLKKGKLSMRELCCHCRLQLE